MAEDRKLQQLLAEKTCDVILTPHVGELARLTGKGISDIKEKLPLIATELSKQLRAIVVAKDARTFVCKEHQPVCVNIRGNSGMATAGSGDVLAGIIAALLAQGLSAYEASCVGVYLHACAGDLAAEALGEYGVMAGDIAERISSL